MGLLISASQGMLFSTQCVVWLAFTYLKTFWSTLYAKTICSTVTYIQTAVFKQHNEPQVSAHDDLLAQIEATCKAHETAGLLQDLIETDGAGSWPPRSCHGDAWPRALVPYHAIYLELAPSLPAKEVSLDDDVNLQRRHGYRTCMRNLLHDRVDVSAVTAILAAAEAGDGSTLSAVALNGFFACIALSRHAFRWATIPVVKLAQEEKIIDLPPELELPWPFLCRRYGVTSQGGNLMSNFFYNFDETEQLVYEINCGMSEMIRSAEYHFAHVFFVMEQLALPIYYNMVMSILFFERGQTETCLGFLKAVSLNLRHPLKAYYTTLVDSKIPRSVWMSYVQGFQGWGAGEVVDGVYVEYDGLSGNQQPLIHMIDAFLGLDPYLSEEDRLRYVPLSQRKLSVSLREHSFRHKAKWAGDVAIEGEMEKIVKQMRVFRAAHRARAGPYLSVALPERLIMTAGKSVLEKSPSQTLKTILKFLDDMLVKREKETA